MQIAPHPLEATASKPSSHSSELSAKRDRLSKAAAQFALPVFVAGLALLLFRRGGYFWPDLWPPATAAVIAAGAMLAAGIRPGDRTILAAGGLLAAGLIVSASANGWPASAAAPLATIAVALAAYMLASREPPAILPAVVASVSVVALLGLLALAFHWQPWITPLNRTWRIASTLTYSNAAAAIFAMTLPAALLLGSGSHRRHRLFRAAAAIIGVALLGTLSRSGILCALVALAIAVAGRALRPRDLTAPAAGVIVGGAALVPALAGAVHGTAVDPKEAALVVAGSLLAAAIAVVNTDRRRIRRVLAVVVAATALGGVLIVPATHIGPSRLTASTDDRARVWSATFAEAMQRPVTGTGPGTYSLIGVQDGEIVVTRHAHNEYLQAFSETGLIGVATVVAAIALCVRLALRRRPADPAARATWLVAVAAGAAFLLFSVFDFIWRIPAVIAVVFAFLAVAAHPAAKDKEHLA